VGGVLSLLGTQLLLQSTAELDAMGSKREAFGAFLLEVEQYRGELRLLREAAETGLPETYDAQRTALQNAGGELFAAAGVVRIVAEDATGRAAAALNDALLAVDKPEGLADYDVGAVTEQVNALSPLFDDFLDAARAEVGVVE